MLNSGLEMHACIQLKTTGLDHCIKHHDTYTMLMIHIIGGSDLLLLRFYTFH